MRLIAISIVLVTASAIAIKHAAAESGTPAVVSSSSRHSSFIQTSSPHPLLKEMMGVNGHTVNFRPTLYRPDCELVRDYHNLDWDIGTDTSYAPKFPMSKNQVDWDQLYGSWKKSGFDIDVCVQFGQVKPNTWKDLPANAFSYGEAFGKYFGPSGEHKLADSVEIGNEPGDYPDPIYRSVFENMARGIRKGDPKLKIVTCAAVPGKSEPYAKSLSTVAGLESLYDVINIHTYAFAEQYPTWRRSFPEDSTIKYLKDVNDTIAWRNAHAPGKQIWITEFGWDASTKPPPKTGDFSKWMSSTETQQAQYLVRSFLVFSGMDIQRAYIYFFDDNDEPQLHGSSGLTRHYQPKPSYYAVAHLYKTLGDYRFVSYIDKTPDVYTAEYRKPGNSKERIWAVWSPTGNGTQKSVTLPAHGVVAYKGEKMPMKDGPAEKAEWEVKPGGQIAVKISESPVYLWVKEK